ncbi:MAG: UDP-N-acetylmuramoyl-L-alanine--D-glutamate ligase [Bacteroidota bacterium]|nr:UDP-N-acetylmuramoyl-L-alanine--D-glutamate ligase [Bacteroidota bacterium]
MTKTDTYSSIVVLGAGESGVGSAILAQAKGIKVLVSDKGIISVEYKKELDKYGIEWEEGMHSLNRILNADAIIKSPGIPHKAEPVAKAIEKGIPILSEIEFAGAYCTAKCIGITGTNGKTTTTSLTYHILKEAGLNVGLAGNIGKSFARSVAEDSFDYYVLELSSFQLDDTHSFRNEVSILLNITPDHLDRYNYDMSQYIDSKFKIVAPQNESDYFIYNIDDNVITEQLKKLSIRAKMLPISQHKEVFPGAFIKDDTLYIGIKEKNEVVMKIDENPLRGTHNRYNTMAASLASKIMEVRKDVIRESLKSFQNVEHRLETVARIGNVEYINDSKATNVNSTWYALESMNRPTIWIAGGIDKGNDYEQIKPMVREKVKVLICLGKDNKVLEEAFTNEVNRIVSTTSMKEAVKLAASFASEGDAILLSPACASFDLFMNYEDRGRQFKNAVLSL